jgi:hypothetical protein
VVEVKIREDDIAEGVAIMRDRAAAVIDAEDWTVIDGIDEDEEYECPNPAEPSTILFQIEYVDGDDWGIYEIQYEGGAAAYEAEFGAGLSYTIKEMIGVNEIKEDEWFVIEGFSTHYWQDYYGEVDCSHEFTKFRAASIYDRLYFGV